MGKSKSIKKYFIISGLNLRDNNRGTAALGYGAISFLLEKGELHDGDVLVNFRVFNNFLKFNNWKTFSEDIVIGNKQFHKKTIMVWSVEDKLFKNIGLRLPFTRFGSILRRVRKVAAINGGDGFSDIYSSETFNMRLTETHYAMLLGIPVIQLPQTLGPFNKSKNMKEAARILKYSEKVYVRDDKFVKELDHIGVKYELTKDLSAFMLPMSWGIEIKKNAIGINVSGMAYSNKFRSLSGQFDNYPLLIDKLIQHFQRKGLPVYLIPHSYHYGIPEENNDDMVACQEAYNRLIDKTNVFFVDHDLISPQVKYTISKMSFFIGTRMHANFAAIYTGVPLFGLAYSYKFEGAFNANGLDGKEQTAIINNISKNDIPSVIEKIEKIYQKTKVV